MDILFIPHSSPSAPPASIGFLSRLADQTCAIGVFRNQPEPFEVRNCLKKLYIYFSELNRGANRNDIKLKESGLGKLWIISTTASENLLNGFGVTLNSEIDCAGIYSLHEFLKAAVIAVNQLPAIDETLWLRVLGKGNVQKQAVSQLLALPDTHPYKKNTLRMLTNLRIVILNQTDSSEEDREDVMELSTAYLEWEQKTLEQGENQGKLSGAQRIIIKQLNHRFDEIQPDIIKQIRQLSVEQLEHLAIALIGFTTVTEMKNWLASIPKLVEEE